VKTTTVQVVSAAGLAAAAAIAWIATRSAGPVPMPAYTEQREGPLMEHLVTADELLEGTVFTGPRYPPRVAPAISSVISHGFAPLYQVPDPQAAALPAEEPW
jgi:hypothetical protein